MITAEVEIDALFQMVLPCTCQDEYDRALVRWSELFDRGHTQKLKMAEQVLRRRVLRRTDYVPNSDMRENREGYPWTWAEDRILDIAFESQNAESKEPVTVEYVATILNRPPKEVADHMEYRRTVKLGMKGFF
jgi:hypothetical protein